MFWLCVLFGEVGVDLVGLYVGHNYVVFYALGRWVNDVNLHIYD